MSAAYEEIFGRNIGIITAEEQAILRKRRVCVAGTGGAGSNAMYVLARMGVANFTIADPECYTASDNNRQYGASMGVIGRKKVDILEEQLKAINPEMNIRKFPEGLNKDNIDDFLNGGDVLLEEIEYFLPELRKEIFDRAQKKGIFIFNSPALGFGATLAVFSPEGPSYENFFGKIPDKIGPEYLISFGKKLFPIIPSYIQTDVFLQAMKRERSIPTIAPGVIAAGVMAGTDVALFLLKIRQPVCIPSLKYLDLVLQKISIIDTTQKSWSIWTKIRLISGLISVRLRSK